MGYRRLAKFLSFYVRRRGCIVALRRGAKPHSLVGADPVYLLSVSMFVGWLERKRSPLDPVVHRLSARALRKCACVSFAWISQYESRRAYRQQR